MTSPSSDPELHQSFYQPLLQELSTVAPGPVRVEIPPTLEHWEAAFVAPHVSLARGWERQLDVANNPIFYTEGALTPGSYRAWLDEQRNHLGGPSRRPARLRRVRAKRNCSPTARFRDCSWSGKRPSGGCGRSGAAPAW